MSGRSNGSNGALVQFKGDTKRRSRDSDDIKKFIAKSARYKKDIQSLADLIKQDAELPSSNIVVRSLSRVALKITPDFIRDRYMPHSLMIAGTEDCEPLDYIENLSRRNMDNIQDAINDLLSVIKSKTEEINELKITLNDAIENNWDAKRLQELFYEGAGIELRGLMADVLDARYEYLPQESKDAIRKRLLEKLQRTIQIGEHFIHALQKLLIIQLDCCDESAIQLFGYVKHAGPMKALKESASSINDMNTSFLAMKQALVSTFELSIGIIEDTIDHGKLLEGRAILSPEMSDMFKEAAEHLDAKIVQREKDRIASARALPELTIGTGNNVKQLKE